MSHNKMLIDATHPEETRVVVLKNGRVEEFDYESAARKLLRGNIYLAKVTRVEPSLQAAFVDYGGNRHGFLAFNEIHPDYYQIPVADRQALIEEEAAQEAADEREAEARAEARARRQRERAPSADRDENAEDAGDVHSDGGERFAGEDAERDEAEAGAIDVSDLLPPEPTVGEATITEIDEQPPLPEVIEPVREIAAEAGRDAAIHGDALDSHPDDASDDDVPHAVGAVEDIGVDDVGGPAADAAPAPVEIDTAAGEDAMEEVPTRTRRRMRSYKIQEVIRRRQIILVQVVKEERGTKGAALTTYLSLAGRYTVLMPNTARGGGISRKITNAQDRKRLKAIADELEVPEGMGLIIRTAGAARTRQEIKRDFEYLLRLWESVRDMTLQSVAPSLVYEEGDLIKRSIRDLYTKDVDEIVVAGDQALAEARDFMRMLMPSHAKNVIEYAEPEPLFTRYQIERQLNAMFSPYVHLKSGGYLVINQTEALVAIDVNSGKSTREYSIEETALNTNVEAADEIARQLKLRDLAGLIVIDFIDMEEKRNNRYVERRLKDALRFDRARIQVGRISHFGLMEMSRQRLRTGVLEGSTTQCPHCQGTGIIRSVESVALAVLRGLEDALMGGQRGAIQCTTTAEVALYILNHKRAFIIDMERRNGASISVQASDKVHGANFTIERVAQRVADPIRRNDRHAVSMDWGFDGESQADEAVEPVAVEEIEEAEAGDERSEERSSEGAGGGRRRRRRRGRRGERDTGNGAEPRAGSAARASGSDDADDERPSGGFEGPEQIEDGDDEDVEETTGSLAGGEGGPERERDGEGGEERRGRRGRRRGRRGGRRGRDRDRPLGEAGAVDAAGEGEAEPVASAAAYSSDEIGPVDTPVNGADAIAEPANETEAPQQPVTMPAYASDAPVQVADMGGFVPASVVASVNEAIAAPQPEPEVKSEPVIIPIREIELPAAALEPAPAPAPAPVAEPRPETNGRAARTEPVSSQPVLARVVVAADGTVATEEPKPQRRGWWSRKS